MKNIVFLFLLSHFLSYSQIGVNERIMTNIINYSIEASDILGCKKVGGDIFKMYTDTSNVNNLQYYSENPINAEFIDFFSGKLKPLSKEEFLSRTVPYKSDYMGGYDFGIYSDSTNSLNFSETWTYDTVNGNFYKYVNAFSPRCRLYEVHDDNTYLKGAISVYWTKLNHQQILDTLILYEKIQYDVDISNCSDFCGWNPDNFIEVTDRIEFARFLFNSINSGKIKAYRDSAKQNVIKKIDKFLMNSVYVEKTSNTSISINSYLELGSISQLRFYEDWVINKTQNCFRKQVNAIALIMNESDSKKPVIWIYFN